MSSRRAFIIHGWGGSPDEGWFPWLERELEQRGFSVVRPAMPNTDAPELKAWVEHLRGLVGSVDSDTYFVGHSIGCQTILRYLEVLPRNSRIGGVVLVAGWVHLTPEGIPTEQERAIAAPWLTTPMDFEKIAHIVAGKIDAIFSDDDLSVPITDASIFREKLAVTITIEYGKGHFSGSDGITELKSARDAVLRHAGIL